MILQSIILAKKPFGEGHVNITLLSKEIGLVNASAFGGKRCSKRFKGCLEFFNILDLEIDNSKNNYSNITCIKDTVHKFSISDDINKYIAACYILEQCSLLLVHNDHKGKSGTSYFDLATSCLYEIEANIDKNILFNIAYKFQITLLQQTGFLSSYMTAIDNKSKFRQMEELNLDFAAKIPKSFSMLQSLV